MPSLRLTVCVLVSVALHGVIWMLWSLPEQDPVLALNDDHLAISVGMQAALAGAVAQSQQTPQTATHALTQPKPQKTPLVKQPVAAQAKKVAANTTDSVPTKQKITPVKPVKTVTTPPAKKQAMQHAKKMVKPLTKQHKPKKVVEKTIKTVSKQKSQPAQQSQTAGKAGKNGSSQNKRRVQETGTGDRAASASNSNRFDFAVRQHLLKHKKTPHILNPRRKRGTVTLQFMIDRQGHILDYKVKKSAHVRAFDKAALRLLKKADPFPTPPSDIRWQTRRYRMDIDYRIQ
ncbi:MAG: energy transducer TonB [Vibrio sp.]